MIDKELIAELVSLTDIVDVISRFRDVKKNGSGFECKSPFVDERTPSFKINRPKQMYKCFSSGKAGGVVNYLMDAEKMDYMQAVKFLAEMYNFPLLDEKNNPINAKPKADYEKRKVNADEKEGEKRYVSKDFTLAELKEIFSVNILKECEIDFFKQQDQEQKNIIKVVYKKLFQVLSKYNVHSLSQLIFIKEGYAHIFKSNERYPIFMFEFGNFRKFYQPKSEDKSRRFIYDGEKPKDFLFGYQQLCNAQAEIERKKMEENVESGSVEDETQVKKTTTSKIKEVIECTGERDALNVAAMGFEVLCLATESAVIHPKKLGDIFKKVYSYYRLPDIDKAGIASNHKVCMDDRNDLYLDIKTIELPTSLLQHKDFRGNACKDVRDYLNYYSVFQFKELVEIAEPYRFWDEEISYDREGMPRMKFGKPIMQTVVRNARMYNFLNKNGIFKLESKTNKNGFTYIHIDKNVVSEIDPIDVKAFINGFLKDRKMSGELRDVFYKSPQLSETSLNNIQYTTVEFSSFSETEQFFFFNNKTICVDQTGIKEIKPESVNRFIWDDGVIKHDFELLTPFWKITCDDDGIYDIEIVNDKCMFLRYLINTSRIHWKKEMQERVKSLKPMEQDEYVEKNKFNIAGSLLTADEVFEQKQHLINKLYVLGYLLHGYKNPSRPWAIIAMDNNISEEGESHGGSGKSLLFKSLEYAKLLITEILPGRNQRLTENAHIYENVTEKTNMVLVDDANAYLNFDFFYSDITGDMKSNPKNVKSYTIEFSKSPKFVFTTNFSIRNLDQSTLRRILFTSVSDWYHSAKDGIYEEVRQPINDFNKNLFLDFDTKEWNLAYNSFMQMCHLYLSIERVDPPMGNVQIRNLQGEMGMAFNAWADTFFSTESGNLDTLIIKRYAFKRFVDENKVNWTPQKFTKALKAWVTLNKYKLDPKELQNAAGRIIRKRHAKTWSNGIELEGKLETFEMIYIQTKDELSNNVFDIEDTGELVPSRLNEEQKDLF